MYWLFLCLFVLLLAYLGDEKVTKAANTRTLYRSLLVVILAYAVLCMDGSDRDQYLYLYNTDFRERLTNSFAEMLSFMSRDTEIGFAFLARVCNLLGLSGWGFLFVVAIITNIFAVKAFYRFRFPLMVFFLYIMSLFFNQQSNLVRQMIAVAIGFYSTRFLIEKKWKTYLLFVFIAFTMHRSAIVLLLAAPLMFLKDKHQNYLHYGLGVLWVISLALVFIKIPLLEQFSLLFGDTRYISYADESVTLGLHEVRFDYLYNMLVVFLLLFARKTQHYVYVFFFVMGCVMQNIAFNAILLMRVALFFTPIYSALLPTILADNQFVGKKKSKELGFVLQTVVFLFYLRILIFVNMSGYNDSSIHLVSLTTLFK